MIVAIRHTYYICLRCELFLPNDVRNEICSPKNLITKHFQVMRLIVVNRNPKRTILRYQITYDFQTVAYERQPNRVLNSVIIVLEGRSGIVGRINEHALHLAGVVSFQCPQREQIVTIDEPVVEDIAFVLDRGMLGFLHVLQKNTRLQTGPVILAYPGEFKTLFFHYWVTSHLTVKTGLTSGVVLRAFAKLSSLVSTS